MKTILRSLAILLAVTCAVGASSATAATIEMQLLDMDLQYNSEVNAIYDSIGLAGGEMDPGESDTLEAAQIKVDGALVAGPLTNTMYGDFLRSDVTITGTGNSLVDVGAADDSFGFHWFDDAGNVLKLNFNELQVLVTDTVFFLTGEASSLVDQKLPGGYGFNPNEPILISYSATLPGITGSNPIDKIVASGAMTISGTAIPEPATLGMMAVAAALAVAGVRRRKLS